MQSNLPDQIEWLSTNLRDSHLCGFQYGTTASLNFVKPAKFNFDNQRRVNSRNVALSTVGQLGHLDLQVFRNNDILPDESHMAPPPQNKNIAAAQINSSVIVPKPAQQYSIPDSAFLEFDLDGE